MKSDEIRIRGVSESLKTDLMNISKNVGVSLAALLKPELRKIAASFPEHMKVKRD